MPKAVCQVIDRGYSTMEFAEWIGVSAPRLYLWLKVAKAAEVKVDSNLKLHYSFVIPPPNNRVNR